MLKIHVAADPTEAAAAFKAILEDERLSLAAAGLLLKILTHAPEWDVNAKTLYELGAQARGQQAESRRGIRMMFREFELAGYMRRTPRRHTHGAFYTLLEVFDVPRLGAFVDPVHGEIPLESGERVYVVSEPASHVVKIGTTTNWEQRLPTLRGQFGSSLVVRWLYYGNVELESHLHRCFADLALGGEWFDFEGRDAIAEIAAAAELYYLIPEGTTTSPQFDLAG